MQYFSGNSNTISELKKEYYNLAKTFHPDKTKDNGEIMKIINNEFEFLFNSIHNNIDFNNKERTDNRDTYKTETSDVFTEIINKIIHFDNIVLEICGYWLYITGNTKPYKELFKAYGFAWSAKKICWYWRPEWAKSTFNRKSHNMDEIRTMYGSNTFASQPYDKLEV